MALMRVDAIWNRWMGIIADLVTRTRERWRIRRAVTLALTGEQIFMRDDTVPGEGAAARVPAELAVKAHRRFVTLEMPTDEIVVQRINVPARAREFLSGIVRNQIERLSPWPVDQTVYGFDAAPSPEDPASLDARVLITARATVEAARDRLAALGVAVDRIVARGQGVAAHEPVTLWSRSENGSGKGRDRLQSAIGAALLAGVGASVVASTWLLISAAATRADLDEVAARSAALQRKLQGGPAAARASSDPAERAWLLKETSPSGVVVLEALSRALPDQAYVTELSLQKTTMRVVGLTEDAASLIAPLEGSGQFADVHFFAPTTRGPDGRLFWFHIEARVAPQLEGLEH
jgi:general secretion pathway protein L